MEQRPSTRHRLHTIKGDNSRRCIWSSELTSKMAGPVYTSPLLRPRPDFMGAGRGCGPISIFSELIHLSKLSHFTSGLNFTNLEQHNDPTNHLEDETWKETSSEVENTCTNGCSHSKLEELSMECSCKVPEIVELPMECSSKEHSMGDSTNSENNYPVFELDSNGQPSKQAEYQLSDKTLHLFDTLTSLKIPFRTEIYKPKENRVNVDQNILYCKNLFLKDRKGVFYLVICHEDQNADLKILRKDLKAYRNFNFATAQDMDFMLGVEPGGVTPLALMNRGDFQIAMVICKSLQKENDKMMFHPMDSNLAVEITMTDLLRFLKHVNQPVTYLKSN